MAGRKPKPTSLKVLEGNPGKRQLNPNEPKLDASVPKCPAWLSKEAKREWKRLVPFLEQAGLLTQVDRAAFAGYCQSYADWVGVHCTGKSENHAEILHGIWSDTVQPQPYCGGKCTGIRGRRHGNAAGR